MTADLAGYDPAGRDDHHGDPAAPPPDDPFGYRERINEEAQRTLDMLRVTLNARLELCAADWELASDSWWSEGMAAAEGAWNAYADVLSLLGPEPAWWTDPEDGSPF